MKEVCGIKHGFGDQTCNRVKGHIGCCRCKGERQSDGSLMYSQWVSRNGEFYRHLGYYTTDKVYESKPES